VSERLRRWRVRAAWLLLVGSVIAWPVASLTVAKHEPQFVLGLSFLAIVVESASLLTASQVHRDQSDADT
jgi:hypothetical protein